MLDISRSNRFKKDYKLALKRGKDDLKIKSIISKLAHGETPGKKHKDHQLKGNYQGFRECHIEPDWLLIYMIDEKQLILERTGSHSDLFN